jgi:hypothetical protein
MVYNYEVDFDKTTETVTFDNFSPKATRSSSRRIR